MGRGDFFLFVRISVLHWLLSLVKQSMKVQNTDEQKKIIPIRTKTFVFSWNLLFFGSEKSFEKLRFPSLSSCCFRPVLSCLSAKMSAVLTKKSSKIGNFLSFTFRIFINSPPKNQELLKIGRSTISQALRYPCRSRVPNLSPLRPKEKLWAPFNWKTWGWICLLRDCYLHTSVDF